MLSFNFDLSAEKKFRTLTGENATTTSPVSTTLPSTTDSHSVCTKPAERGTNVTEDCVEDGKYCSYTIECLPGECNQKIILSTNTAI